VRLALGGLILAAAGMKAYALALDPLVQDWFLASPRLLIAAIEVEMLLGLWLLSGWSVRAGWVAALGFFAVMTGVSLDLATTGQTSCGCFGQVPVSPWLTFAVDLAAVGALVIFRPARQGDLPGGAWLQRLLKSVVGAAVLLALLAGGALLAFDDPLEALARMRGDAIAVQPAVSDAGAGERGTVRNFRVQLVNRTDRPVRVLGGTTTCSCVATDDLPFILQKGETGSITVSVRFVGAPGRFQHSFVLLTDTETQPVVVARFAGRIAPP
jgi:hypothetical protein